MEEYTDNDRIAALFREAANNNWVKITDELPVDSDYYQVLLPTGVEQKSLFVKGANCFYNYDALYWKRPHFDKLLDMFKWIWGNRPHVSVVSGEPLFSPSHSQWHWQFSHTLNKQSYGLFKLRPENIDLLLPEEHTLWGTQRWKITDKPEWQPLFEKEQLLKERYHLEKKR